MSGVRKKQELSILTSYSESVCLLASQISIGKKPVELVRVTEGYVLQCDWPELQLGFEPLYTDIAGALKQYGVNRTGRFWSEPSPVFEVEFESQSFIQTFLTHLQAGDVLQSVQSVLLLKAHKAWMQANPEVEKPSWEIDISLRLLHVLPNLESKHAIVRRVTHENCSECVYLWNMRTVFDMGALLRWYRSGQERCTIIRGEIKLSVLFSELDEVVRWRELGLYLGLPKHELKVIEKDYARDTKMCKIQMLSEWLDQCEKATWADVVTALLRSGMRRIARNIADKYNVPFVTSDDEGTARSGACIWNEVELTLHVPGLSTVSAVAKGLREMQLKFNSFATMLQAGRLGDKTETSDIPIQKMELEKQSCAMEKMDAHLQEYSKEKGRLEEGIGTVREKQDTTEKCLNILVKVEGTLQQQVEEKEKQLQGLRDGLSRCEQVITELRVELAQESKQLKIKLESLIQEKQLLLQSIEAKGKEIMKMRKKLGKVKTKMDTARAELADVKSQLKEKKSQLQEVQEELLCVQAERDELQRSVMEREATIDEKMLLQSHSLSLVTSDSSTDLPTPSEDKRITYGQPLEINWTISEKDKQKCIERFLELKSEDGLLHAQQARGILLQSGLPKQELSQIWKLVDMKEDNALTEEEFCIAVKLVTMRRRGHDIPDTLPVSLQPSSRDGGRHCTLAEDTANLESFHLKRELVQVRKELERVQSSVANELKEAEMEQIKTEMAQIILERDTLRVANAKLKQAQIKHENESDRRPVMITPPVEQDQHYQKELSRSEPAAGSNRSWFSRLFRRFEPEPAEPQLQDDYDNHSVGSTSTYFSIPSESSETETRD